MGFDGGSVDETASTLRSMYTGDASIGVSRMYRSTGKRLGGTWYLSLDGNASMRIDAGASAEEVREAIANLTTAGNISVADGEGKEGYNGERSWVVTFRDWNDPNRTAKPPVLKIGDEDLTGIGASAYLEAAGTSAVRSNGELPMSGLCVKAVVEISSLLSSGFVDDCFVTADWQGSTTYAIPPFAFDANSSSVEIALATVDQTALGRVWVSQAGTLGSGSGVWNITFVENVEGRIPGIQCGSDADVSKIVNASCEAIGGSFALVFGGNSTQEIAYDASAAEVRARTRCTIGIVCVSIH